MPRSRKINREKVLASLDKTCPKCGFTITPDLVKRVDFERIECPQCGERFVVSEADLGRSPSVS
jgi:ribosomal protein S27AE